MRCSPLLKLFKPGSQTVQQLYQVRFLCFEFPQNPLKLSLTREIDAKKKTEQFLNDKVYCYKVHIFCEGHKFLQNLHLTFDWPA